MALLHCATQDEIMAYVAQLRKAHKIFINATVVDGQSEWEVLVNDTKRWVGIRYFEPHELAILMTNAIPRLHENAIIQRQSKIEQIAELKNRVVSSVCSCTCMHNLSTILVLFTCLTNYQSTR